jgi:L-arabinokinase
MLVAYVSGHGFGHAVRTAVVLRRLRDLRPDPAIEVVTNAPAWLFPPDTGHRPLRTDVGLVQRDGLEHDEDATLAALTPFLEGLPRLADEEAGRLRHRGVRLVLGDIPALAFDVADRLGVPAVALGNFSWDDVYAPLLGRWPGFAPVVERLRASYARAHLLLRLPFHLEMSAFPRRRELPLVARRPTRDQAEARRLTGIPPGATAVLLAFGGFELASPRADALRELEDFLFLRPVPAPRGRLAANLIELPDHGLLPFPDLLAACDAVITKPGYGMVADLLACRVPALYAERPRFAEYPVLAAAMERHGRALPIAREDLERGLVRPSLERLLALRTPWADLPLDGGERAAEALAELLG